MVKGLPEERTIALAHYMVDSGATVRQAAARFGVSKSTVHKDLTERLPQIDHHLADEVRDITTRLKRQNAVLYAEVQAVLLRNKSERHIRGGNATRDKYREEARKRGAAASRASRTQNKTGRPEGKPVPQI